MESREVVFSPEDCFKMTFSNLEKLKAQRKLCDVVLRVEGKEFHAHKLLLIASCPYFEAMFLSGMSESRKKVVELKGIHPDAFQAILGLFYSGQISINSENVQIILSAASIFQLESLKTACADFLVNQLAPCNSLGIRAFAQAYGCSRLADQAWKHVVLRFPEVTICEEFLQLELAQVCQLLSCDNINVSSEEQVFNAAFAWIEYDLAQRSKHTALLLKHIRLPLLPLSVLADKVKCHHLISNDLECRNLLDEVLISYHLLPDRRCNIQPEHMQPRHCHYDMGVVYAVGGLSSVPGNLSSVERYIC